MDPNNFDKSQTSYADVNIWYCYLPIHFTVLSFYSLLLFYQSMHYNGLEYILLI